MTYFATYDEQLETWLAGKPEHHGDRGSAMSRCVPDFSCCRPHLLAPLDERVRFYGASRSERQRMTEQYVGRVMLDYVFGRQEVEADIPGVRRMGH